MDTLHYLQIGLAHIFTLEDITMLVVGLLVGMAVSIMPGLGLVMGVVLALPFTYRMSIEPSIILLTAIYVSGTYAGCFTAILYRIPGEPMDVPLLWDGYGMTKRGEAAKALGWALIAALTGGLVSSTVMVALADPLSAVALSFGSPDYFAAVFLGLTTVVALAGNSLVNSFISLFVGLLVATIGVDPVYGAYRFTYDSSILQNGIPYVMVLVGAYGLGEVFTRLGQGFSCMVSPTGNARADRFSVVARNLVASADHRAQQLHRNASRNRARRRRDDNVVHLLRHGKAVREAPRAAGPGLPEGIVAPQIGSTASVAGHMIPLLTLGIPGSGATAVILAAFLLHGIQPGPMLFMAEDSKSWSTRSSRRCSSA